MKWIKTQNGNIVRLGAISQFWHYVDKRELRIGLGNDCVTAYSYTNKEQAEEAHARLIEFIIDQDADNCILEFPKDNPCLWLKKYDIDEADLGIRNNNALKRAGIETLYDFVNHRDVCVSGQVRGIGTNAMRGVIEKLDAYVNLAKTKEGKS